MYMTFQSFKFIVFFVFSIIVVFSCPKKTQNFVLLICNLLFVFLVGGIYTICFILISTITTFFSGILIQKSSSVIVKKISILLPFLLNIGILFVLKYSVFFIETLNIFHTLLSTNTLIEYPKLLAPIGISFYTFWMLGYLLDVYWESYDAEKNFIKYATFATYFPLITSGPIVRYQNMSEQFDNNRYLTTENVSKGILRICWGFFQKLVIADNIAKIVNQIYDNSSQYTGFYIFLGTACFAIQLYTDFCGCIDIAIGCSKILGIELPENFNTPFFSKSVSEFWRRWHITLGIWFKDYFMYPILKSECFVKFGQKLKTKCGKKAARKIPVYLAMFFLWFTIGFWHGGLWKYIIGSGLLHCFYMVFSDWFDDVFKKIKSCMHINDSANWWKCFQMIRTFLLVCVGFIFFRADGLMHAFSMCKNLFYPSGVSVQNLLTLINDSNISSVRIIALLFSVGILFFTSFVRKTRQEFASKIYESKIITFVLSLVLVAMVFLFAAAGNSSFIYFQF